MKIRTPSFGNRTFRFSTFARAGLLCCLLAGAAPPGRAALLVYEGFDYSPGANIVGQNGGIGFANAWQANGSGAGTMSTSGAGSLSYTDSAGNVLVTSGNHGFFSGSVSANNSDQPNRDLAVLRNSGTTWISFVGVRQGLATNTLPNNPYPRGANLALFNGTSERLAIGNARLVAAMLNGAPSRTAPSKAAFSRTTSSNTFASRMRINCPRSAFRPLD